MGQRVQGEQSTQKSQSLQRVCSLSLGPEVQQGGVAQRMSSGSQAAKGSLMSA